MSLVGRPRTPLAKAIATGRTKVNPGRYKNRKEPKNKPLGKPSRNLTKLEVKAWNAFVNELPWLAEGDRAALEQASRARAACWEDAKAGVLNLKHMDALRKWLSLLGATPADRSRIATPPDDDDDAAESYFH